MKTLLALILMTSLCFAGAIDSYREELGQQIKIAEENVADVERQLQIVTDRLNALKAKRDALEVEKIEYETLKVEKASAIHEAMNEALKVLEVDSEIY